MINKILLLFTILFSFTSFSQDLTFNFNVSKEIEVCQGNASFELTVINNTGALMENPLYEIQLPQGVEYEIENFIETSSYLLNEFDVSSSESLQFTSSDIGIGDSIVFEIFYTAKMEAIEFQSSGGIFRNTVVVTHDDGFEIELSESYNILYPALSVLDLAPFTQTVLSGAETNRSFRVINAGNGKTDLVYITDVFTDGANLVDVSKGTISGDTIILTSSDFESVGNNDGFLDNNEFIMIEETIETYSCSDITSSSTINAFWGCEGTVELTSNNFAHVSVDFQNPSLKLITEESLNSCFGGGEASVQTLKVTNTGSGIANGIKLNVFKSLGGAYDESIYSRIDENSFTVKNGMSGVAETIVPTTLFSTDNSGEYACLGSDPIGKVILDLPNILPGDTLILEWDMYSCCINSCDNDKIKGWRAEATYTDICELTNYNTEKLGQETNNQLMSVFTETPTDLFVGEIEAYNFTISSHANTLPQDENSSYEVRFYLEEGLVYESLEYISNTTVWEPTSVDYNTVLNEVTAIFKLPEPFILPKSELNLNLSGDCGSRGWKTIGIEISFNPDNSCESACAIPMVCLQEVETYLHCPLTDCNGLSFLSFNANRINFGLPDNDLDGSGDLSGDLNNEKVKFNRAMVGDTIRIIAIGEINSVSDTWSYGKLKTTNNFGVHLESLGAIVQIYDASEGTTYEVNITSDESTVVGSEKTIDFDLSIAYLSSINPSLTSYVYANGDSLIVIADFEVISSVDGLLKETTWENDFYVSSIASPIEEEKRKCDIQFDRTTLIGFSWRNDNGSNHTVRSCSKKVKQNFGLSIGNCCSNYAGGNLFPYEYRNWGIIKEAKVIIPDNYQLISTTIIQKTTKRTNAVNSENLSDIEPDLIDGNTIYYDLEKYYLSGVLDYGDDGFNGTIEIELAPNCDVPQNTYEDIVWTFNYEKSVVWEEGETGYIAGPPDKIRFVPSNLELSSVSPWVDAITKEVTWNIKVKNNSSSDADYTWIHVDVPENLEITSVLNTSTDELLTLESDLFLVGTVKKNSSQNFVINGQITNCDTLLFKAYTGYECVGYPMSFETFTCNVSEIDLYVEPKPSAFQARLFSEPLSDDPCSPLVEVGLDISSVKIAHMYDMEINVLMPGVDRIEIKNDSSYFQYNISNPFGKIPDPLLSDSTYNYTIENYNSTFSLKGIPGVLDLENNRYKLKTTLFLGDAFLQGDYAQFQIEGKNACGTQLPTVFLDYDPNTKFRKDNTAGLHLHSGNTWSASWADYDNDGFEDLFVPNKNHTEKSALYHNNGDGTLSPVSEGPISNDLGESVAGTWGDYDNDGDLDLFVANNTYSENKLYNNQGDGTFISITDDPIVNLGLYSHSSSWADYDRDGFLDLIVSDIHPTHFNFLFRNKQDGTFESVNTSEINQMASSSLGVSWADYDNDGDQDLFIANTNGENNALFRNNAGVFEKIVEGAIVNDGGHSIGGIWGDYDNDLDLDLFVTNSRDVEPNFFYENQGDGTFEKITSGVILSNASYSHGASWIDFDNDGDLDLLVANDQNTKNYLFSNNGDKTFTKMTNAITEETSNSYGTAWADYDNDGDYDLHISNHSEIINDFFINEKGACNSYFGIKLIGCNSNSAGIGARIELKATILGEEVWQMRELSAQTSALGGQNSLKTIFGLNNATLVDSIVVRWPSGLVQVLTNQTVNQIITMNEDCGSKICGTIFYDENDNGTFDSDEEGVPNKELKISPSGITIFTNSEGYYQVYVNEGSYTIELVEDENWEQSFPIAGGSYTVDVDGLDEYCGNDFGCSPICLLPDLALNVGATAFRRGLENEIVIEVANKAAFNTNESIELELKVDDFIYLVGDTWSALTEFDTYKVYTFTLGELPRLSDTIFTLIDSVDATVSLELPVLLEATINYGGDECDLENNQVSIFDITVGSIDPNDKQVLIQSEGAVLHAKIEDTLIYKIRFQNVGNYAARRVLIVDSLSSQLDWETIQFIESSHLFSTAINDGVITWVNNNIELPDSTSDPLGSNGSVSFSVQMKKNIKAFNTVENKAHIQFDYNPFIITNSTETIVLPQTTIALDQVYIYPNPALDYTIITLIDSEKTPQKISAIQLSNVEGKLIFEQTVNSKTYQLNTINIQEGIYTVVLKDGKGMNHYGKLIVQ